MRGRKPKATAEKERAGSYRKDPQRRNKNEPKARRGYPKKPNLIAACKVASAQWDETCKTLDELGILTIADRSMLWLYCQTYAEYLKLQQHVREHGCSQTNDKGNVSQTPEAVQVHRYADRLIKLMAEMGLTPSSRSRLVVKQAEEEDNPIEILLQRMGASNN